MAKFRLFPRYRRPSVNRLLGISQAKRQLKKATGVANVDRIVNTPKNAKQTALRRVGYYSVPIKFLHGLAGQVARPAQ